MAADSDEALKRELIAEVGEVVNFDSGGGEAYLRVFPDGATEDQKTWEDGGLTFTHGGLSFGSNDAAYYIADGVLEYPIMAWELTDGLNRGNSVNSQYQRFHHALGAVRNGIIGIYFLKEGQSPVLPDLYKMALSAWEIHGTPYIISQDWQECKKILELWDDKHQLENHLHSIRSKMQKIFDDSFYHCLLYTSDAADE